MMRSLSFVLFLGLIYCSVAGATSIRMAVDITGTWSFSVDLDNGQHSTPTFNFKQEGAKLTGTYKGQLGERKVTGTVKGNKVVFVIDLVDPSNNQPLKVTYSGTVQSPTKLAGAIETTTGFRGKWIATKK